MGRICTKSPAYLLWLCLLSPWPVAGCSHSTATPEVLEHSALVMDRRTGRMLHEEQPFSGVMVRLDGDVVRERAAYRDGRRHGLREQYYADGAVAERSEYRRGRLHGSTTSYWPAGIVRSVTNSVDGVGQGLQRQFYENGAIFKQFRLVDGKEQGMQQAWRRNGALYANYEMRDGRAYGLRRSKLCSELTSEEINRPSAGTIEPPPTRPSEVSP